MLKKTNNEEQTKCLKTVWILWKVSLSLLRKKYVGIYLLFAFALVWLLGATVPTFPAALVATFQHPLTLLPALPRVGVTTALQGRKMAAHRNLFLHLDTSHNDNTLQACKTNYCQICHNSHQPWTSSVLCGQSDFGPLQHIPKWPLVLFWSPGRPLTTDLTVKGMGYQ